MRRVAWTTSRVPRGFVVAGALGVVHAGFSLYLAAGGTLLVWSLGTGLVESLRGREWLLALIGAVKLILAVVPLVLARWGWPARRVTRSACWLGALALVYVEGIVAALMLCRLRASYRRLLTSRTIPVLDDRDTWIAVRAVAHRS